MELPRGAAPAQQVVPDRLGTGLRDRERDAAVGARGDVAVELGARRVLEGVVVHPLRRGRRAVRLVDVDAEAGGVLLQHRLRAVAQLVGVLVGVLGVDREQRFLVLERVAAPAARLVAGDRRGVAAGPGGDAAVLVAGLLCAEGREVGLQARGVFGRGGRGGEGHAQRGQAGGGGDEVSSHGESPLCLERAAQRERDEVAVGECIAVTEDRAATSR